MNSASGGLDLINICQGASAKQSSLSEWSTTGEAERALTNGCDQPFAFHTRLEPEPWWQVDFGRIYALHLVRIFNRRDIHQARAFRLQVEVSVQGVEWDLLHSGFAVFLSEINDALTLRLCGLVSARYLRLSLPGTQYLHLYKVEVFSSIAEVSFQRYRERTGFTLLGATVLPSADPQDYQLVSGGAWSTDTEIVGLSISHPARLGNSLQQLTHAIRIAESTGLRYIRLAAQPAFSPRETPSNGIVFLSAEASLPVGGGFIEGVFFDPSPFQPLLKPFLVFGPEEERMHSEIASRVIRPQLFAWAPDRLLAHHPKELMIHVRSGDVFEGDGNLGYRQPPLSFYTLGVQAMIKFGTIDRVRMVYEDTGNPVIQPLQDWLRDRGVPLRIQSGSLRDDILCMLDAPHVMFGFGTFGHAICRLSKNIRTLYYFEPEIGGSYRNVPMIDTVVSVTDTRGDYVAAWNRGDRPSDGEWRNTPEQRRLMIEYPVEALTMKVVKRPSRLHTLVKAASRLSGSLPIGS